MTTTQTTQKSHIEFSHILYSQEEVDVVLPLPDTLIQSNKGGATMSAEELLKDVDMSVEDGDADMQLSNVCSNLKQGRKE